MSRFLVTFKGLGQKVCMFMSGETVFGSLLKLTKSTSSAYLMSAEHIFNLSGSKLQDHRLILPKSDTRPRSGICCVTATNLGAETEEKVFEGLIIFMLAGDPGQTHLCQHVMVYADQNGTDL